jgi:hypothetical protein
MRLGLVLTICINSESLIMLPILLLTLASAAKPADTPKVVKAEPLPEVETKFRRTEGWVGGDGAFSCPVSDQRTLWLFSDTWVGAIRAGKRSDVTLVNNTVGVQEGMGSNAQLTFAIARAEDGKPKALFVPPDGRGWFWLYAGITSGDELHVFLPRFEKSSEPGAFGFRAVDLWLGKVSNPTTASTNWTVNYTQVHSADFTAERKRSFGSALLRVNEHIYIYGYEEKPGKPFPARRLLVARVPEGKLDDYSSWRYLTDGTWQADARKATGQIDGLATEFSVSYLPDLKHYALVYTEHGLSERILGRFATSPEGPWSEPLLLYTCPEMKRKKKVFSYAAKAHPELARGNELIVSYVVNAFELGPVLDDAELYWPKFVRIILKT